MKKGIKLFIFIQILLLLSILVISNKSKTYASEIAGSSLYYENCNNSVQLFPEAIQPFKNSQLTRSVNSSSIYTNNYAGSFIDGNGILNIGYLQSVDLPTYGEQVLYIQREFSYNQLSEIKDAISEKMIEYNVYMVGINEESNRVDVYVSSQNIANAVIAYLQGLNLYQEDAIYFNIDPNNYSIPTSKIAYGGDKINDSVLFFLDSYGTICVNAYDNETGQYGVLTNAHVAEADTTMYHNGNILQGDKIGVATKRQHSGTIDAAFVPFDKQNQWEVTTYAKDRDTIYSNIRLGSEELIIEGAPVVKIGQTSGYTTGKITSTNFDCTLSYGSETVTIRNTIKYSNESLPGDSGGPVYYYAGEGNRYLIAMNFAGPKYDSFTFGIGCSIFNVMREFNVTPILDGTIFDTTDLENNEIRIDKLVPRIPSYLTSDDIEFEIPSYINGRTVTEIGDSAFENQFNIAKFVMPTNLKKIGNSAFKDCKYLQEITIPDTVTDIGANAFEECFLMKNLTLPANLLTIGDSAFKGCCSLKSITVPDTVTRIGYKAFIGCDLLTSLTLPFIGESNNNATNNYFGYIFGATSGSENGDYVPVKLKEVTLTKNVSVADAAFQNCANIEQIVLPSTVTQIGASAFSGCTKLTNLTIPNQVEYIGTSAFENCTQLGNMTLPTSILEIGDYVFKNCTNLSNIVLPNTLTTIGKGMFENCTSLTNLTLPSGLTTIDNSAFSGCSSLENITIPETVTNIGAKAFKGCSSLTEVTLPESVENVGESAFQDCVTLNNVLVEKEIAPTTNLGTNAFDGCQTDLQIIVPMHRLAEYKNKNNWKTYASKIISTSTNYETLDIHCLSNFIQATNLEAGYNKLYRLEVECGKNYTIKSTSNQAVQMNIYNSTMQLLYHTFETEGNNNQKTIQEYLGGGTYYISISFLGETSSGTIQTNYKITWPGGTTVSYNTNNYVQNHLHQIDENRYQNQLVYYHKKGAGVYQITLTGTTEDGTTITYPEGAIQIYSDQSRTTLIDKFSLTGCEAQARTKENENGMVICLLQNSTLYINVEMADNNCTTLNLTIKPVEVEEINLFNLSETTDTTIPIFVEEKTRGDQFKRLNTKELGKYELTIGYNGVQTSEILVVLFKLNYNSTTNSHTLNPVTTEIITGINNTSTRTLVLGNGTYYLGYFNKADSAEIDIDLTRKISQSGSGAFKVDPDQWTTSGSQINIMERDTPVSQRSYGANYITVGFTRIIYINHQYGISQSRLDYNWYSSNENVATVSAYGTVLGKKAGTVKIMAVLKTDPSKTFVKEFTIIEDSGTEEVIIENLYKVTYSELENGKFHLDMEKLKCPYPWIQDYTWDIVIPTSQTGLTAQMDTFGYITVNQTGTFTIIGEYKTNSRFKVLITVVVE